MYIQFTIGTVSSLYCTVKNHFLFLLTISFYLFSNLENLKLMVRAGLLGYPGNQKCVWTCVELHALLIVAVKMAFGHLLYILT
jgi:hypothetical protein